MNDTPTPRTDEAWSCFSGYTEPLQDVKDLSHELERELTAVTEQRDEARKLAEKYRYLSCDSQEEADETLLPWENNQPTEL